MASNRGYSAGYEGFQRPAYKAWRKRFTTFWDKVGQASRAYIVYHSSKNTDGIQVYGATGGMNSVEGFYKRISKETRPFHIIAEYNHGKRERNETMREGAWRRNCKGEAWYLHEPKDGRKGRIIYYNGDKWVMTTEDVDQSTSAVYVNTTSTKKVVGNSAPKVPLGVSGEVHVRPANSSDDWRRYDAFNIELPEADVRARIEDADTAIYKTDNFEYKLCGPSFKECMKRVYRTTKKPDGRIVRTDVYDIVDHDSGSCTGCSWNGWIFNSGSNKLSHTFSVREVHHSSK